MNSYRVIWEIDVEAGNPIEAAERAAEAMHPATSATIFTVVDETRRRFQVELRSGAIEECQED